MASRRCLWTKRRYPQGLDLSILSGSAEETANINEDLRLGTRPSWTTALLSHIRQVSCALRFHSSARVSIRPRQGTMSTATFAERGKKRWWYLVILDTLPQHTSTEELRFRSVELWLKEFLARRVYFARLKPIAAVVELSDAILPAFSLLWTADVGSIIVCCHGSSPIQLGAQTKSSEMLPSRPLLAPPKKPLRSMKVSAQLPQSL